MQKKLTVSVAAYNAQDYLEKCLDSFLRVNHRDALEVIIVDDGSTDSTREIGQRYVDRASGLFRLISKENGGHGSTINCALENARGRYFRVIDSDDWIDPDDMDRLLGYLDGTNADMVVEDYREVRPTGSARIPVCLGQTENETIPFDDIHTEVFFPMHSITIRTEKLKALHRKIPEHCFFADTSYFYNAVCAMDTVMFVPCCTYQYRLGREGQSMSSEGKYRHIEDFLKILASMIAFYETEDKAAVSDRKRDYLYRILQDRWNLAMKWFLSFEQSDKDWMLVQFQREMQEKYPELVRSFRMVWKCRPLRWNLAFMLPACRRALRIWRRIFRRNRGIA